VGKNHQAGFACCANAPNPIIKKRYLSHRVIKEIPENTPHPAHNFILRA
jgi:hypothetical protein